MAYPDRAEPSSARPDAYGAPECLAFAVAVLWLGSVGWLFLTRRAPEPDDALAWAATLLAVLLPVALLGIAAALARLSRSLRAEGRMLAAEIDTLRAASSSRGTDARIEAVARAQAALTDEIARMRMRTDEGGRLAAPLLGGAAQVAAGHDPMSRAMPSPRVASDPDGDPLAPEDFIRALDFPDDEGDEDGFRILRAALRHRPTARLAATAQDVLTRLAQDGVYMDDLEVHPADPVVWRAFAAGARGGGVAALGGIRDRSSLALTAGRMRDDPASRDAIHRFLRTFDAVFAKFAATASESELIRFADTRTARAFMLCAQVAGAFDASDATR